MVEKEGKPKKAEDERSSYLTEKVFSYNNNVLIGNWIESRYDSAVKKNNAILPGMMIDDKCESHQTASQATYTDKAFEIRRATFAHFKLRDQVMAFKMKQGSNIILHDADQFLSNYTTMNTLVFDVWPRMRYEECLKKHQLGQKLYRRARYNALDSYGSYGLVKRPQNVENSFAEKVDRGMTSYERDFPPKTSEKSQKKIETEESDECIQDEAETQLILDCQLHEDLKNTEEPLTDIPDFKFEW